MENTPEAMRLFSSGVQVILFREGGLKLVGRTTADGDASAEVVVSRQQAECIRQMLTLEELDRREDELLNSGEDTGSNF